MCIKCPLNNNDIITAGLRDVRGKLGYLESPLQETETDGGLGTAPSSLGMFTLRAKGRVGSSPSESGWGGVGEHLRGRNEALSSVAGSEGET